MKLAKKVLSVVLAVVLALGAFAVVGSANGNPDADYQVKIWLTGTVGEVNWTSATKLSMSETGDESAPGGTIEVQPGDEVFVRFYITNNYYVHTFQSPVFFSTDLLDAAQIYEAQTGKDCSKARLAKMHLWNTAEHYWTYAQGTANSAYNASTMQTDLFNANVAQNWPTDDEGNVLLNMDEWRFNFFNNLTQETSGETCIWEDEVWLFSMPVSIPEDAQPGDTFYVTVPEGLEQRDAKPNGALRLSEIGIAEGESEPCDIVDAQALLTPNMKWGNENQYYDLSKATLTLQVPGASEPELDYTNIDAALDAASKVERSDKTAASLAALDDAINAATDARMNATEQTALEKAATALNEAIANLKVKANYDELTAQITRYEAITNSSIYPAADWAAATEKYNDAKAVDTDLSVDAQATVDEAATALKTALDALAALDYSAIEAKYNELAGKDVANYTDATAGRFNAALAAAKSLIDNKNAADQNEINAAYDELVAADAALALKAADYTALNAAIKAFEDVDAKAWTPDSYAAAKAKYDDAKAIEAGLDITAQPAITAAAEALDAAIKALVPASGANYADLDAAIAAAKALVADNYVSFADVAAALAAAEAVDRNLTANDQDTIDAATEALVAAMGALVEADADYSAVTAAITAAKAKIAENDQGILRYTDESIAKVNEAIDAVVEGLKKKDQPVVNGYVDAIDAAVAALEYRPYDYSKIIAHIEAIEANPADYYDAAEYAAYLTAKEDLVWDYTHEQFAKAKLQEINFLKVTVAAAEAADYSDVEAAIEEFEAKIAAGNYTDDSIAAVRAEIAKVVDDLNVNHQAEVDAYAAAIRKATAALVEIVVEYVDYTRLDNAIAAARALDADLYTASSYHEITVNLYTAESISRNLTADQQDFVDDVAKTLEDAIAALEKKADYSALDAAILRAGTYDQNAWTDATWAVVEEKLAAAEAVNRDLGVSAQDEINVAAKELNDALDALKAKEVVSSISTINWTPSEDTHNTFTVVVNGRMSMIQFIEMDGGTRTYDRYNKNVTIVSYNAEGVEVNSLDRSVAYEVWTINTNLIGPDVKARAKYLSGASYIWETETYNFTVNTLEPTFDAEVRSITPAATSGKKGAVATTVVVGPDAQGVRFVMENGTTTTYFADKAVVLDNGDLEFTGKAWMNEDGLNSVYVKVKVNGVWETVGCIEYTVE